jgi:chitodextrinase
MRRSGVRAAFIATMVILGTVGLPGAAKAAPPTATCRVVNDWGSGFQGDCTIANPGPDAVTGWTLNICFTPATVRLSQVWGAAATTSGNCVAFTGIDWSTTIAAGGSVSVGFLGSPGGGVLIGSCTLNDQSCAGGGSGPDTAPPTAPANLRVTGTTSSSVSVAWTASTDDVGVTGYDVLRAPGASGGAFTQVGTSATTSFAQTGLTANTTYRYQVRARDAAGNLSPVSNTATVTTPGGGGGTGGCSVTATVQTQWGNGYVIQPVTVANTGTSAINGWTVTFTLPSGHTVTGSWNATLTVSGQTVTARSAGHNGALSPGQNTTFGLQASRPNGNTQTPSGYQCTSP